ncbi:MAG: DUF4326 domain-containing protein [Streptomycetaceae bacterium]|nr:DUF4326 domain-containing protein [Streptomycetaceae bacterium]
MPNRIQRRRVRGWVTPLDAQGRKPVYVGRPTRWGNPFVIGKLVVEPGWWNRPACPYSGVLPPGTYTSRDIAGEPYEYAIRPVRDRADATDLFRAYVEFHDDGWDPELIRRDLGGRDLACWCRPPEPGEPDHCHAAVLIELSNRAA